MAAPRPIPIPPRQRAAQRRGRHRRDHQRAGFARQGGLPNLRAYLPATDKHVFSIVADSSNPLAGARPFVSKRGVSFLDWFRKVATAQGVADLPPDMVDPYL